MATNTAVELDLPEAAYLADLTGIQYDLEKVREFVVKLQAILSADKPDYVMAEALSTAILVTYCRTFAKGVRRPLQEDTLQHLTDGQRSKHEILGSFVAGTSHILSTVSRKVFRKLGTGLNESIRNELPAFHALTAGLSL